MSKEQLTAKEKREWERYLQSCRDTRKATVVTIHETVEQKQKRIKKLLKTENWALFCTYYFKHYMSADFAYFHLEAGDAILLDNESLVALEWPRECAKSVFMIFMVINKLVRGELDGLILGSKTEPKAKQLIKDIQIELSSNEKLINDFGDFNLSGSWKDGFYVTGEGIGFWAFSLGQDPSGTREGFRRPSMGILDDVDSFKTAKNQRIIKEQISWIFGEFFGCFATKNWQIVLANNRVVKNGVVAHFVGDIEEGDAKREGLWHSKVYWTEDPDTHEKLLPEEGGVPCWIENYTIEHCIKRFKAMGRRDGMRQLYHTDVKPGNIFTDEMMPWVEPLPLDQYDALVSYTDPAYGESKKGCYRAVILIGLKGHDYDILWCWLRLHGSFAQAQYDLNNRLAENGLYRITNGKASDAGITSCVHWTEANDLQKPHLKRIYEDLNRNIDLPFYPKLDMDKKGEKLGRIETLEPLAEVGHVRFNVLLKNDKDMRELRDQFMDFPNGYLDGIDAVHGGIVKLNKTKKKQASKSGRLGRFIKSLKRQG
jgi:hypothetical protein